MRLITILACAAMAAAQTKVDIATQTKNADFSNATFVKPFKMVSSQPSSCSEGEAIFKIPEGVPYICHPANTWAAIAAGSGGPAPGISDFAVAFSGGLASVGGNCSVSAPCNAAFGAQVYSFTNAATVSNLTGMTTASEVYIFLSGSGVRTVGLPGTAGATVSNMAVVNNVTSFPNDSLPIATCSVLNNQFTGCTDYRAFLRGFNIAGTNGINVTRTAGGVTIEAAPGTSSENPMFGPVMNGAAPTPGNLSVPPTYDGVNANRAQLIAAWDYARVRFPSGETGLVTLQQALPEEWTGPLDAEIWWTLASGTGNVGWKMSTSCAATGWNAFVPGTAQAATAGSLKKTGFAALTTQGCAAGSLIRVAVQRDNGASGNAEGDAQVVTIRLKLRKN